MSKTRARVLLTGFGPFPGVPENASATVVERLAMAARNIPGVRVCSAILPVEWQLAPKQTLALIASERPTIALHFGVSRRAKGIVLETRALNRCKEREDACGKLPAGDKLEPSGVDFLTSTFPADSILNRLQASAVPAELSDDAGGYLCNAVLYASLSACSLLSAKAGFIHLPVDLSDSGGELTLPAAVEAGLETIQVCLDAGPTPPKVRIHV